MPTPVTRPLIRLATDGDAAELARLRFEFRAEVEPPTEDYEAYVTRATGWMASAIADGRWLCWVAEDARTIVGSLWLYRIQKIPNPNGHPEEHAYVSSFYVRAAVRNTGVGSMLLAEALAFCEARRVDSVVLWPTERSRPLYMRHGFRVPTTMLDRPVSAHF